MKKLLLFAACLLLPWACRAQITASDSAMIGMEPIKAYAGGQGSLLLLDGIGNVKCYGPGWQLVGQTKLAPSRLPDGISDAGGMQFLFFFKETQEAVLLDRRLSKQVGVGLDFGRRETAFYGQIALSADGGLWLLDENSFSLQKAVLGMPQTIFEIPLHGLLPPSADIFWFAEQDGMLVLGARGYGFYFFDPLGKLLYKRTLPKSFAAGETVWTGSAIVAFGDDGQVGFEEAGRTAAALGILPAGYSQTLHAANRHFLYRLCGVWGYAYTYKGRE